MKLPDKFTAYLVKYDVPDSEGNIYKKGCFTENAMMDIQASGKIISFDMKPDGIVVTMPMPKIEFRNKEIEIIGEISNSFSKDQVSTTFGESSNSFVKQ